MFFLRSKKATVIMILILVMAMLSGCYLMPVKKETVRPSLVDPPVIIYDTVAARIDNIEKYVSLAGTFVPANNVNVYFTKARGQITLINFGPGSLVNKGDVLLTLDTETIGYNIKLQELSVQRAQLYYDNLKKINETEGGRDYELGNASIDLELAKMQLEELKKTLDSSILLAPVSGEITYMNPVVGPGAYTAPYLSMYIISDIKDLQIQYTGLDKNLFYFISGTKVQVIYDDIIYEGAVIAVDPDFSTGTLQKILKIDVKDIPETVRMGENAIIKLVLAKAENVLVIPKRALRKYPGRTYVQILEDGVKKERDVVTGIESAINIEIKDGLKDGDLVIMD